RRIATMGEEDRRAFATGYAWMVDINADHRLAIGLVGRGDAERPALQKRRNVARAPPALPVEEQVFAARQAEQGHGPQRPFGILADHDGVLALNDLELGRKDEHLIDLFIGIDAAARDDAKVVMVDVVEQYLGHWLRPRDHPSLWNKLCDRPRSVTRPEKKGHCEQRPFPPSSKCLGPRSEAIASAEENARLLFL